MDFNCLLIAAVLFQRQVLVIVVDIWMFGFWGRLLFLFLFAHFLVLSSIILLD